MDPKELLALIAKSQIAVATGGQLTVEQANKFIDLVISLSSFLGKIQSPKMTSSTYQLNTIGLASRILRGATEGQDLTGSTTPTVAPTITPVQLSTKEVIIPFDVTFSFLEENIEGGNAEQMLNNLFAKAFMNDVLDLAINGDTTSADGTLKILDGWLKKAAADASVHTYAIPATPTYKSVFQAMLKLLPLKWKSNPADLCFMVAPDVETQFRDELGSRNTVLGDKYITEFAPSFYQGIAVVPIAAMPGASTPKIMLTKYDNLAVGFGRNMRVGRQVQERKRIIEYTITAKTDAKYVVGDMIVLGA